MKTKLSMVLMFMACSFGFGQNNPVQNLKWEQWYENMRNIYSLTWEEPALPHANLIGYNIYKEDVLFRFQTKTSLGCHPDWGGTEDCGYLEFLDLGPFTGCVSAVYEGNIESERVSFQSMGAALEVQNYIQNSKNIFPNPTKGIVNFSEEINDVKIFDISGKALLQVNTTGHSVDISNLTKGIYIIYMTTKTGAHIVKKIIKD